MPSQSGVLAGVTVVQVRQVICHAQQVRDLLRTLSADALIKFPLRPTLIAG